MYDLSCPRCGRFQITGSANASIPAWLEREPEFIAPFSHAIRKAADAGEFLEVSTDTSARIQKSPELHRPSPREQSDLLVKWLGERTPGSKIEIDPLHHRSVIGAADDRGFWFIVQSMLERGFLSGKIPGTGVASVSLSLEGWDRFEQLSRGAVTADPVVDAIGATEKTGTQVLRSIFISHASEDKASIARPLAEALRSKGMTVWFDEYELTLGDSLRERIDEGLASSEFGVVILSEHFFAKRWPKSELDGLFALEGDGKKRILPVWHNIDHAGVASYSPILAGRMAIDSGEGLERVVQSILAAVGRV